MKPWGPERLVRAAAALALVGLALMVWSVLLPRPVSIIVAMTFGQLVGTASLLLYARAIWLDLKAARVLGKGNRRG